jgi:serine/threonine protein kinase
MSKALDTAPSNSQISRKKPAVLPPGTVLEGYQIIRKLSVGGFGVVYLAKDKNDAFVAIKEYLPSSLVTRAEGKFEPFVPPEKLHLFRLGLKSFFEEGRALAQISHPSVVGVHNFFRANETIYMVMTYLQGANLQDFILTAKSLKKEKILRESTIRSLFDEILHGLRIVHQSKMLHLDIKPANLFITNSNKPVLIDFGAARQVIHNDNPMLSRPMYTPGFAAPEMYERQGALGPWSDIYAIGACMFACMFGYPPLDAPTRLAKDKLSIILGRLRGIYSDNMIELVEWCMALDPQHRPQSVLALQKQLADTNSLRYQDKGIAQRFKASIDKLLF